MLLPSSLHTNTMAQHGNLIYENHNNKNKVQVNTTTKPEANNTPVQPDSEQGFGGAPEISRQRRPFATLWFKLILMLCILIFAVCAGGCAVTRLNRYSMTGKEYLFRYDYDAAGGRIETRKYRVPGWEVGWIDCLHGEGEPGEGKKNSTLEMFLDRVVVWR